MAPGGPPDVGTIMDGAACYGLTLHMERVPTVMAVHRGALQ